MENTFVVIYLQALLLLWNITDAIGDHKLIKRDIPVNHKTNLLFYLFLLFVQIPLTYQVSVWFMILAPFMGFLNRQLFFDIPLNLMRGLPWDYLPTPGSGTAWWDSIEYKLFGKGKNWLLNVIYFCAYVTLLIIFL